MLGFIQKLFGGSKSEKDVKSIQPLVAKANEYFAAYQSLSNDQLRAKTREFKDRIQQHVSSINEEIAQLNAQAEALPFSDFSGKDAIYQEVDKLKKKKNEQLEEVLKEIAPEAFAVVKETSRRFKENPVMISSATDLDRQLAVKKEHIKIEGDQSHFSNSWTAGGNTVTWNMVHYDVQLIGGFVLHSGKIA